MWIGKGYLKVYRLLIACIFGTIDCKANKLETDIQVCSDIFVHLVQPLTYPLIWMNESHFYVLSHYIISYIHINKGTKDSSNQPILELVKTANLGCIWLIPLI